MSNGWIGDVARVLAEKAWQLWRDAPAVRKPRTKRRQRRTR